VRPTARQQQASAFDVIVPVVDDGREDPGPCVYRLDRRRPSLFGVEHARFELSGSRLGRNVGRRNGHRSRSVRLLRTDRLSEGRPTVSLWSKVKKFQLGHAIGSVLRNLPIPGAATAVDAARQIRREVKTGTTGTETTQQPAPTPAGTTVPTGGTSSGGLSPVLIVGAVVVLLLVLKGKR